MDKVIDIQNWTRKEEYLFFRTFLNPMISVTVEVDCTTAYRKAKERQQPFSLYYMHAAVTAANRIEEFRYRQVGEEVILYERIDLFTPVQNADGSYRSVRLPAIETFEDFLAAARPLIEAAKRIMPVALSVNHGFVSGYQIGLYLKEFQRLLNR